MAWKDALAFKPDIVVIKLGTNDSKPQNWQYGKEFKQDLEQMITDLRAVSPKARIILCTPIPAFKSSWDINETVIANDIIPIQQKVAKKLGLEVIDLHTLFANSSDLILEDGIHPNDKGAGRMADIISEQLMNQKK